MAGETSFTGMLRIELEETDSTNAHCARLLKEGKPPEGTVVAARSQTAGRGQAGNAWQSEPGLNLTASIILYPSFLAPAGQFMLTVVLSLAVRDTAAELGGRGMSVKWPNDVYAGDRKMAGILIENSIRGSEITATIAGVGLNVNQDTFPPGLPEATSLCLETGRRFDLAHCLDALCRNVGRHYHDLRSGAGERLRSDYVASLYRAGQRHRYLLHDRKVWAVIRGVDGEGRLLLETEDGVVHTPGMKEVQYLR